MDLRIVDSFSARLSVAGRWSSKVREYKVRHKCSVLFVFAGGMVAVPLCCPCCHSK